MFLFQLYLPLFYIFIPGKRTKTANFKKEHTHMTSRIFKWLSWWPCSWCEIARKKQLPSACTSHFLKPIVASCWVELNESDAFVGQFVLVIIIQVIRTWNWFPFKPCLISVVAVKISFSFELLIYFHLQLGRIWKFPCNFFDDQLFTSLKTCFQQV